MKLTYLPAREGAIVDRNPADVLAYEAAAFHYPAWSHGFTWNQIMREWSYNHAPRYLEYAERRRTP